MTTINPYNTNSGNEGGSKKGSSENPYTQEEFEQMQDDGTWQGGHVESWGYRMPPLFSTASYPDSDSMDSDDSWPSDGSSENSSGTNDNNENPDDPFSGENNGDGEDNNNNNSGGGTTSGGGVHSPYPQTTKTISGTAWLYKGIEGIGGQATFYYQCSIRISGYTMSIGVNVYPISFTDRKFWATAVVKSGGKSEKYYRLSYNEQGYIFTPGWTVIGDVSFELPKSSSGVTVDVRVGFNHDTGAGHTNQSTMIHIYPF